MAIINHNDERQWYIQQTFPKKGLKEFEWFKFKFILVTTTNNTPSVDRREKTKAFKTYPVIITDPPTITTMTDGRFRNMKTLVYN